MNCFIRKKNISFSLNTLVTELELVMEAIMKEHNGLYQEDVKDLIHKIKLFGFHFASLDIRQDSRVHHKVFY